MVSTSLDLAMAAVRDLIGAVLLSERRGAGLTQSQLARRANVGQSTLSQIETGALTPSELTLKKIETALGVDLLARLEDVDPGDRDRLRVAQLLTKLLRAGDAEQMKRVADFIRSLE